MALSSPPGYPYVLMHTSVQWLSRGACVKRFYKLLPEINAVGQVQIIFPQLDS